MGGQLGRATGVRAAAAAAAAGSLTSPPCPPSDVDQPEQPAHLLVRPTTTTIARAPCLRTGPFPPPLPHTPPAPPAGPALAPSAFARPARLGPSPPPARRTTSISRPSRRPLAPTLATPPSSPSLKDASPSPRNDPQAFAPRLNGRAAVPAPQRPLGQFLLPSSLSRAYPPIRSLASPRRVALRSEGSGRVALGRQAGHLGPARRRAGSPRRTASRAAGQLTGSRRTQEDGGR